MSDTPLTDAETAHRNDAYDFVNPPEWEWVVTSDFARQLERRLNDAQAKLSTVFQWVARNHPDGFIDSLSHLQNLERVTDLHHDRLDALERELKAARELPMARPKPARSVQAAYEAAKAGQPAKKTA